MMSKGVHYMVFSVMPDVEHPFMLASKIICDDTYPRLLPCAHPLPPSRPPPPSHTPTNP
jgi:hypothetical protein